MILNIAHLYPELLNIYGDRGNIICLKKRCQWRGIKVTVAPVSINAELKPKQYDLYFGGGGQDRQQLIVSVDLQKKAEVLKNEAERGVPMLAICGTYQLFGHYFKTHEDEKIQGISIFDAVTIASNQRKIGNIVIKLNPFITSSLNHSITSNLVGFENHSGNTFIKNNLKTTPGVSADFTPGVKDLNQTTLPFGKVIRGFGNNGQDKTEGAVYKNVFGCYLHGPVLPKNPHFADYLIQKALEVKYRKKISLQPLDDALEWQAHQTAVRLTKKLFF